MYDQQVSFFPRYSAPNGMLCPAMFVYFILTYILSFNGSYKKEDEILKYDITKAYFLSRHATIV